MSFDDIRLAFHDRAKIFRGHGGCGWFSQGRQRLVGHDRQLWHSTHLHKSSKRPFPKRGNLVVRTVQS
jgi:hypothetical protein